MADSGSGSGTGSHNRFNCLDSVSPHSSMRTNTDDVIAKINQQINMIKEGAKKERSRSDRFTFPNPERFYKSDEFVSDEMSQHGSIDFVALDVLKDGDGCSDAEATKMQQSSAFVSRRKVKAKLRKRRRKALKAAAKALAQGLSNSNVVTVHGIADSTAERMHKSFCSQDKPEQEGKKRKESPTAADEPEFKMVKTESIGDSSIEMEASERAAILVTASNPGAEGQSSVLSIEEELTQLKMKLQKKKVPLSISDAGSHTEENNEDLTSIPASKAAAEGQIFFTKVDFAQQKQLEAKTDHVMNSTEQQGRQTQTHEGTQRKQGCFWRPGMKITAQRVAFVCSVCKFHSFYRSNMAAHLESKFHKDHFKFLSEHLSEPTVDFLQTHFSNKHKSVEDFINQIPNHRAAICQLYEDRDLTRDIDMEHFMRKAEAAHCLACDEYIPMQRYLIQQHLKSSDHNHNCKIMMEQSKNTGLSIAQNILSHRFTHKKLKLYLKNSVVTGGPEVKPEEAWTIGQRSVPDAEADMMKQEAETFCEQVIQASEAVGDRKDEEVEPFCGSTIQAAETVGDRKDQEVEPLSEGVVPAAEAEKNGTEQQAEPMCERMVPAAEKIRNEDVREKPEKHNLTELLFDLLDEEDDVEGVELGEEELGENDYI
ncbi:A-kinase anchor protein 8 isoform X3 [Pangasianodon hypophthalmus]|uniref:A-kinase anchor protein 8 isoform X3 n=1 Tax=Pangasianodon hypophthalmus TaxID=310915 RepID=UPI002306F434|nr:A-kinase anchor protein 8 isoform X3 [Pangasianodon hypophthalmus]